MVRCVGQGQGCRYLHLALPRRGRKLLMADTNNNKETVGDKRDYTLKCNSLSFSMQQYHFDSRSSCNLLSKPLIVFSSAPGTKVTTKLPSVVHWNKYASAIETEHQTPKSIFFICIFPTVGTRVLCSIRNEIDPSVTGTPPWAGHARCQISPPRIPVHYIIATRESYYTEIG